MNVHAKTDLLKIENSASVIIIFYVAECYIIAITVYAITSYYETDVLGISTKGAGTRGNHIKMLFCLQVQVIIMPTYLQIIIFV